MFLFDWPTRKLCVLDSWINGSTFKITTPDPYNPHIITRPIVTTKKPEAQTYTRVPAIVVISLTLLILVCLLLLFNNHEKIINSSFCVFLSNCCANLRTIKWFGQTRRRLGNFRRLRRSRTPNTRQRNVYYKRLQRSDDSQSYVEIRDSGENSDELLDSSSDEAAALFSENQFRNKSFLRINDGNENANRRVSSIISENQDIDDNILDIDDAKKSKRSDSMLNRRGSSINMLNADTDDEMINV